MPSGTRKPPRGNVPAPVGRECRMPPEASGNQEETGNPWLAPENRGNLIGMLFINFRVGDGEDKAAWLDAEFSTVFGKDRVFRSSRSIDLGHDYEPIMWGAVENCSAMIVVIGDRWLSDFCSRLFEPDDVVRKEIAMALAAGKPVIPVLGLTGCLPRAEELPPDLAMLANCQYIRLSYRDSHALPGLVDRLIDSAPELGIGAREGIEDLASWSRERTALTSPELPADLALLGRQGEVERMRAWLAGPAGNLIVQGQTTDEVAAFAAAVLEQHNPHHRAVRVSSEAGWKHAVKIPASFPAVVVNDGIPVAEGQQTRHVIIARDGFEHRHGDLVLPRVPRDEARDAFLAAGVPRHRADEYAGLARRSLRALTRRLSPNMPRPPWTEAPASAIATPLVLISRWSTVNSADHEVIARITGRDYAGVERFLSAGAVSGDPLVHRSGSRWQLADPFDAWTQLMAQVSASDISRFSEAVIEVLSETDPVLELPDSEAPFAGMHGVDRTWSGDLRRGLAHGLARLGAAGTVTIAGEAAETHAARVVHRLLEKANEDRTGLLWRSLSDVLPLLAEACPRVFLEAVRKGLRGESPLLRVMFEDAEERTLYRHSAHTGLLWALETVTWAPEHSTAAVLLLARLAEVDPGGGLGNRPAQSLVNLLTARPVSPIALDRRPSLINHVRRQYAEVGWQLLCDLTEPHMLLMFPERPRVRHDWSEQEAPQVDTTEAYGEEVLQAVLADLAAEPSRWTGFLPRLTSVGPQVLDRFLDAFETTEWTETRELWEQGKKLLNREQGVGDKLRHLTQEQVERLSAVLDRIEPTLDPTRHAWAFGWHPDLPGVDFTDLQAHQPAIEALRQEIVAAELPRHGVDGLARLAEVSDRGDCVGWTLAQVAGDTVRDEVFTLLGEPIAAGWIRWRSREGGRGWVAGAVAALPEDPAARTAFLLALPVDWVFEWLDVATPEVSERFWQLTPAFPFPAERAEEYLAEVLGQDRPEAVIDALSLSLHGNDVGWRPSIELVEAAFHRLRSSPRQISQHLVYSIGRLLTYLCHAGQSLRGVASWEIAFARIFHDRRPRALLELIAADPANFVELHRYRFLPDEKLNPEAIQFFMTGERLRCIPGRSGDQVDREGLRSWVEQARLLLDEVGMRRSGDRSIGTLLSDGPAGEDGAWPAEAVREVLELEDADELRVGFGIGLANNVGFSTRGVYDGGQQERQTAANYLTWADAVENDWPHTAQVLRDHAESLRSRGRHWDSKAEDDHDE
ncbi:TIR domain-containing protein [Amycolatopsis sp. 195334CR]|uniref:TIR domain-containing protein n=1 Tax=Amycolatopsis sp. 195334CR TaxID=2814588 RepID=UPI001A907F63|nr:TIR domain-containing protein [Amycolatopsis sp. 195334CR]MBN6034738.1 toll/interleukin-1 receptor domain-containing protein [Amycolatopsis sp. 195334CR]